MVAGKDEGFTLLEVIIAITLVAMMAVGIWAALNLAVNSWVHGVETIDINQRERTTQDLMRKQIASAYPLIPASTLASTLTSTAVSSSSSSPLVFSGSETSLRFVSPNSLQSVDGAGLMLVAYEVEEDSDGNTALVEKEARYTGQGASSGGFTSSVPVFYNLESCLFEYYDPGDAENPAEWLTEWDTGLMQRLPSAVRISMVAKKGARLASDSRQMVIPMHAQADAATASLQQMGVGRGRGGGRMRVSRPVGGRGDRARDGGSVIR